MLRLPRPASGEPLRDVDPRQVGPFRLHRRLGSGGMGAVFLGRDPGGRAVAVKLIRRELADDPEFRRRFEREIGNVRRLEGRHTPAFVAANGPGERPYLATELVAGPTLQQAIDRRGPLAAPQLARLARDLLLAVLELHRAGIVHRDLKPANVILSPRGAVLVDLGIARAVDDPLVLTRGGPQPGTPGLMAPEQLAGGEPNPATDVFIWAEVVVLAGTGRPPFDGRDAVLREPARLWDLDPALRPLVRDALAEEPAERPTAAELLRRVEALAGGGPRPRQVAALAGLVAVCLVGQGWLWGWWGMDGTAQPRAVVTAGAGALVPVAWALVLRRRRHGPDASRRPVPGTRRRRTWPASGHRPQWWRLGVATVAVLTLAVLAGVAMAGVAEHGVAGSAVAVAVATSVGWALVVRLWCDARPWRLAGGGRVAGPAGAVVLALGVLAVVGDLAGGLAFAAGTLAGGFDGGTLRYIPSSDEIYAALPPRIHQAWLAIGLPLALWRLVTGPPGPIGRLVVAALVAAFPVVSVAAVDPCDGQLGRRQRTVELRSQGAYEEPRGVDVAGGTGRLVLYWAPGPRCAWGHLSTGVRPAAVWLQPRDRDGRVQPPLTAQGVIGDSYTGTYRLDGGDIRACGRVGQESECTEWFREGT